MNDEKNRIGVGICTISRGQVPVKWVVHLDRARAYFPVGLVWKHIFVERLPWAAARNEIVFKAKKHSFEWIFFIDDDVFIPDDALVSLMSHGKKIVSGVYWTKATPSSPVIFKEMGAGPFYDFELRKLIEIAGSGLGCCLIHMSVFDAFDKAGIPYFVENWIFHDKKSGNNLKCPVGEDHYFFTKARELGFTVYADTNVLCDHYDFITDRSYPTPDVVRRYTEKVLKEEGDGSSIIKGHAQMKTRPNVPTVVIYSPTGNPFTGEELDKRGVGGAETSIISLGRALATKFGYNVHVFCDCPDPGIYDNVRYWHITQTHDIKDLKPDLFIVVRAIQALEELNPKKDFGAKSVVLWAHDLAEDPVWHGVNNILQRIDKIVALSEFHKQDIMHIHKIPAEKIEIIGHGINPTLFSSKFERNRKRLIYSSTPFRGLDILLDIFPEIQKEVPDAKLAIFSSMKVYGPRYDEDRFSALYERAKAMPGVEYYASVPQKRLAEEYLKSGILAYPNTFKETYCITVIEARAAGVPIVTTAMGALTEVVPEGTGILIAGSPNSVQYRIKFRQAIIDLLTDEAKWEKMHKKTLKSKVPTWELVADEWSKLIPGNLAKSINTPEYWDEVYRKEHQGGISRGDTDRFEKIAKFIKEKDVVLDVGCGLGEFTRWIKEKYPKSEVWGSDFSMYAIDVCRQLHKGIFYANHPVENDDFESGYFDAVVVQHVIEHMDNPEEMINKLKRILKSTGSLILVIPVNDKPWREHYKIWTVQDAKELAQKLSDKSDVEHRTITTRKYDDGKFFEEVIIRIPNFGGV